MRLSKLVLLQAPLQQMLSVQLDVSVPSFLLNSCSRARPVASVGRPSHGSKSVPSPRAQSGDVTIRDEDQVL